MDIHKKIKTLKGEELPKSFPSGAEITKLPKIKDSIVEIKCPKCGEKMEREMPDKNKLEKETAGNVILGCLMNYTPKDKFEGFFANAIAGSIINPPKNGEVEFKDKIKDWLISVLEDSIIREDEKGKKGTYYYWVIAQVLNELGINE